MKTNSKKILSVFLSLLMTLMCMTSVAVQAGNMKMTFHFPSVTTVSAGQDIRLDVLVKNPISIKEITNMILTIPDGFEVTGTSETSPAFNGAVTCTTSGNILNFSITSDGTVNSENPAFSIYMHVSESCTPKAYPFQWKTTAMSCITSDGYNYSPTMSYGIVTVSDSADIPPVTTTTQTVPTTTTTTTTMTTIATTTIIYEPYAVISINNLPDKTEYVIGEQLDLTGLTISYDYYYGENSHEAVYRNVSPLDYPDDFTVDTSDFNPNQSGTYKIKISCTENLSKKYWYATDVSFEVIVKEPETTTTTSTTTTTTTTTTSTTTTVSAYINVTIDSLPTKTAYIIGEELDLSGGKWHSDGIKTDGTPFNSVPYDMIGNSRVDTSAFDNSKAGTYRIYLRENINGLYGENFFEVTVKEPETTTTSEPVMTTTTTTAPPEANIVIISPPYKTVYEIGEELDLDGAVASANGTNNGGNWDIFQQPVTSSQFTLDTSEFDNTKAGTYKIYVSVNIGVEAKTYFEVTVTDNTGSFRLGDVDNDGMINSVDATALLMEYALLSTGNTGTFTDTQKKSADIDGDGMINAIDATFVLSYYAYLSTGGTDNIEKWFNDNGKNNSNILLQSENETPVYNNSTALKDNC